ncbi:uncharacterized protein BO72DRAFT_491576 [Aspergillus fijiensis CBS 313.89]|uniref:Uncharacterized protein n=1 Tax=Aspergillus fijiensis CBS 313.89 TaxID=1448319 RepID=A0A8G1W2Z6_9EURO|nr:uncharacterized protein BO72DRAFT_491576 [Aspergillus fijiensis CBS 313.89]RAK81947.1 hypothetical protein BO72DRAFT_491576 [Aspergillus fijiensis CBS 313.89]
MKFSTTLISAAVSLLTRPQLVSALWSCSELSKLGDTAIDGTAYIHYTSIRDSSYKANGEGAAEPWIAICTPSDDSWSQQDFGLPCTNSAGGSQPYTFSSSETGLGASLVVYSGEGCDASASDLQGGYISFDGTTKELNSDCGTRNKGVTCQFSYSA